MLEKLRQNYFSAFSAATVRYQSSASVIFSDWRWLCVQAVLRRNMCVLEDVRCLCWRRWRDRQRAIMCVKLACPLPCLLALALRWQPSL